MNQTIVSLLKRVEIHAARHVRHVDANGVCSCLLMGVIDEGLYELAENVIHFQADASRRRETVIDICARVERIRIRFGQRECMRNCFRRGCNAGSTTGKPIWIANRQGIC